MAAILAERLAQLDQITLDRGAHFSFEVGHCGMEVVSYLAGEGFTDAPSCASPVLRVFTVGLNDQWGDRQRQKLVPFLPRMVGTAGDGQDETRSFLALDWLIRSFTPAWLDLAGLSAEAQSLRDLRRIVDYVSAQKAGPVVQAAGSKAGAAAGAAVRAAIRAAAGDAAYAAGDAAGGAARAAASTAAWTAAWAAAGAAARAAAGAAVAAAEDAAWAAAGAAEAALRPTVETLQGSALELLDRMIDPSKAAA